MDVRRVSGVMQIDVYSVAQIFDEWTFSRCSRHLGIVRTLPALAMGRSSGHQAPLPSIDARTVVVDDQHGDSRRVDGLPLRRDI